MCGCCCLSREIVRGGEHDMPVRDGCIFFYNSGTSATRTLGFCLVGLKTGGKFGCSLRKPASVSCILVPRKPRLPSCLCGLVVLDQSSPKPCFHLPRISISVAFLSFPSLADRRLEARSPGASRRQRSAPSTCPDCALVSSFENRNNIAARDKTVCDSQCDRLQHRWRPGMGPAAQYTS